MENKGADLPTSPPSYPAMETAVSFGKEKKVKWTWLHGLAFYAGAVSAALIVVAIMSSVQINSLKSTQCKTSNGTNSVTGTWKDYSKESSAEKVSAASEDDPEGDVGMFLNTEANKQMTTDSNGSITVIDFDKGVTGHYDKPSGTCQLSGGVDSKMAQPKQLEEYFTSGQSAQAETTTSVTNTTFVSGSDVEDTSLLPSELHGVCAGKPTTWLNKQGTGGGNGEVGQQGFCWWLHCTWLHCYRRWFRWHCHWHCHWHCF